MKVKPIVKRDSPNTDSKINQKGSMFHNDTVWIPDDDTCLRCVCKSADDIITLNNIIHKFNHTQVDVNKQALIQVGRQYRDGVSVIYITIITTSDETDMNGNAEKYNAFLYNELSSAKIEFQFVDFERITKNVSDILSYTDKDEPKILVIDRNNLNNDDLFNAMCRLILPGLNTQLIESIRIPYNEIVATIDCKWKTVDDECEKSEKKTDINTSEKLAQMNISIFDRKSNELFNILVKQIGNECIREVIADYTEENGNDFFRTISMRITDDTTGKLFYSNANIFGIAKYID